MEVLIFIGFFRTVDSVFWLVMLNPVLYLTEMADRV